MTAAPSLPLFSRRRFLAAAGAMSPLLSHGTGVYTPHELATAYQQEVRHRVTLPPEESRIYSAIAEYQLMGTEHRLTAPQYLLVVDSSAHVQVAMLFWRLLPGDYRLVGASPASTGGPGRGESFATPEGVFDQDQRLATGPACGTRSQQTCRAAASRVFDFGFQMARPAGVESSRLVPVRLLARAADDKETRSLGSARSDGCILLPPSMVSFLDSYGVLDAKHPAPAPAIPLPYRGQYLVVVDSGRDTRPAWARART